MQKHIEDADKTAVIGSDPTAKLPRIEDQEGDDAGKKAVKDGVRPKEQVKKCILGAVSKARAGGLITTSEEDAEAIVSSAVDALYHEYEAGGPAPTREAFAERCGDRGIGIVVLDMKKNPFVKDAAGRKAVAVAVALVVAAGLGLGTWAVTNAPQQEGDQPAVVAHEEGGEDAESETMGAGTVQFGIDAPNWSEESSPFIAHITGQSDAGEAVDFYHAVWADGSTDTVELDAGTYQVAWTSAINTDGSIYRTPEEPTQVVVGDTVSDGGAEGTAESQDPSDSAEAEDGQQDSGAEDSSDAGGEDADSGKAEQEGNTESPVIDADESFEQVPAEDVTQDDLDQILGDIEQAVGNGDETLSGDAGQGVIDSATGNASNNPNADQDKIDQAGQNASGNVGEQPQNPSGGGSDDSSSTSGSDGGSTSGSTSSGSSSSSGSTGTGTTGGSGNSGSTSGGSSQSQPQHTHNWVAQTAQQWVQDSAAWSEQVWVQDSAAWTETVQTGSHIQCSCGQTFSGNSDWSAHNREVMLSTGTAHSYSVVPTYETVYHEATGHYETVNHEATGHYETVTTGYRCSSCGATR